MERPDKLFEHGPEWEPSVPNGLWWWVPICNWRIGLTASCGKPWAAFNGRELVFDTVEEALTWLRDRVRENVREGQRILGEGWLPIERAPKDGTCVDLWWQGARRPDCEWIEDASHWWADSGFAITNPSHFRCIPKGPGL